MSAYRSNSAAIRERLQRATDAGLVAGAAVVQREVKRRLRGGYTSGDFVTGETLNSVTRSDPVTEHGVRVIRVGTPLLRALFWELGHRNLFTRRYERVEVWRPALVDSSEQVLAAFARTFQRVMGGAGGYEISAGEAAD